MNHLFGTDGIRGRALEPPLDEDTVRRLGAALADILDALVRPGRDLRDDLSKPILRSDVLKMEDLRPDMRLKGTVRNVVDFGAFVDVGVKQDGLVHISRLADRYVRNPYDVVSVGDVVDVTLLEVDMERGRIALSMRDEKK